jgi:hypothetical protein
MSKTCMRENEIQHKNSILNCAKYRKATRNVNKHNIDRIKIFVLCVKIIVVIQEK